MPEYYRKYVAEKPPQVPVEARVKVPVQGGSPCFVAGHGRPAAPAQNRAAVLITAAPGREITAGLGPGGRGEMPLYFFHNSMHMEVFS